MDKKKSKHSGKWAIVDPSTNDLARSMSSKESVTTQLSTSTVVHEESILETYFNLLSQTYYDKAKELVDTEKDGHRFSSVNNWGGMLQCLSQLAAAEKGYTNLVFLGHKRVMHLVRTKDSVKSIYTLLIQEFKRMEMLLTPSGSISSSERLNQAAEADMSLKSSASVSTLTHYTADTSYTPDYTSGYTDTEQLLAHISGQLYCYVNARVKMIDFYEQLASLGSSRHFVNFEDLLMMCEEVLKEHVKGFHHPLITPIKSVFSYEVESLCHLLQAQIHMSQWSYLPCVLTLHQAHSKLTTWTQGVPSKEVKSTFGRSSSKSTPYPPLLNWLLKFKGILLSKFGLYFHDILSKQTSANELKQQQWKSPEDFVSRIQTFHKKFDANIYLILDTSELPAWAGQGGYMHPHKYTQPPQGMNTYPPIFSYPADRVINNTHWPNICMLLPEAQSDKLKYFYDKATDKRPHSCYFITRVDSKVWLVVVFETKKSEKDSGINSFMTDLGVMLKCQGILARIKSFAKS